MPTAGETTALGYDAEADGGDPRAEQKLAFTAEFVEGLLADITDRVLEEPSQLEQVRTGCRPVPHVASTAAMWTVLVVTASTTSSHLTDSLAECARACVDDAACGPQLAQRIGRELSRKYRFHMGKSELHKYYQQLVRSKQVAPSFIIDSITKNKSVRSR
jgi:hypothetical protein